MLLWHRLDGRVVVAFRQLVLHVCEWVALTTEATVILYFVVLVVVHLAEKVIDYVRGVQKRHDRVLIIHKSLVLVYIICLLLQVVLVLVPEVP